MRAPALARARTEPFAAVHPTSRWAAALVLAAYVVLGVLWALEVPLGEGPDEPAHVAYAFFLATEGRLPAPGDEQRVAFLAGEIHQPPLAYALMQPFVAGLRQEKLQVPLNGNPYFRWSGGDAANAYLHPLQEQPEWRATFAGWRLLRLLSVVLGAISVGLCYATVRLIWPDDMWLALGAMALVAFNPQWIFHHALVSNDPLLITLGSLLITLSVGMVCGVRRPGEAAAWWGARGDWWAPLVCGVVLGCMLLTKLSGVALLPVPLVAILLSRPPRRWVQHMAAVLVTAGVIAGWWYARNWALYGDPAGLESFQANFGGGAFHPADVEAWREGGWNLLQSSWGTFGWMTVSLPRGYYSMVGAAVMIAMIGLVASAGRRTWEGRGVAAAVLLAAALCVAGWLILFALATRTVGWPGRYLFPAAPALALGLAVGLAHTLPRRSGILALALLCAVLAASLPFTVLRPAYRTAAVPEAQVPKAGPFARFDFGWKRAFELHDATFDRSARSGWTLPIALTWRLAEPVDRPWSVFIHLVDAQENLVAKQDALPLDGRLPTDAWAPGDWYRDRHVLSLDGVAPGSYRLWVGIFDPVSGERLGMFDQQGVLQGDLVDLGVIQVEGE